MGKKEEGFSQRHKGTRRGDCGHLICWIQGVMGVWVGLVFMK
jgi:hypothetical protein